MTTFEEQFSHPSATITIGDIVGVIVGIIVGTYDIFNECFYLPPENSLNECVNQQRYVKIYIYSFKG